MITEVETDIQQMKMLSTAEHKIMGVERADLGNNGLLKSWMAVERRILDMPLALESFECIFLSCI